MLRWRLVGLAVLTLMLSACTSGVWVDCSRYSASGPTVTEVAALLDKCEAVEMPAVRDTR